MAGWRAGHPRRVSGRIAGAVTGPVTGPVTALLLAVLLALPGAGALAQGTVAQGTAEQETVAAADSPQAPAVEKTLTAPLNQDPYYTAWLETAQRAEDAIDANRASNAALEELRAQLVTYRQTFLDSRDHNSSRIGTLKSQLSALGEAPADGVAEPADIAALRDRLTVQLRDLQVPAVVAQEAYSRADGLISELDRIVRERQTRQLLSRGETPLNPAGWTTALRDLTVLLRDISNETVSSWRAARDLNRLRDNAPLILLFTIAGLILLARGRTWAERAGGYLRGLGRRGTGVWRFIVSLGRIGMPLVGLYLITRAVNASEAIGLRGTLFLNELPLWGMIILGFLWLGDRLYSKRDQDAQIPLPASARAAARRNLLYVALLLVLYRTIALIETVQTISEASRAVLVFPVILAASVVLMRLRRIILIEDPDSEAMPAGMRRMAPALRGLSLVVAGAAPLLAAAGYQILAEAIVFPAMLTLAVLCVVLVLQRFVSDVYAWISGVGEAVEVSIVPVLAGFALSVLALPVLALIWGARVADMTELWARFLAGFNVGDTNISPTDFLTFAAIFGIGYAATRAFQGALSSSLLPRTGLDAGGQNAVVSGTGYVGILLSALVAITSAGIDLSSLAIVAGALSVGIGFGLQNIVSNFVSGIILLIERPISEGDWIEVNGQMGYVRDISVRSTRIETFDRTDVIVPNADLVSGMVTNYTRGNTVGRAIVPVGVAYGTDTRRVETILREIANAHPMVLANPAPNVVFRGFGADSLDFEIRAILRDVNWMLSVKSDMNHEIAKRFAEAGIEIPFAQRDIWLRNPEVLRPGDKGPVDTGNGAPGAPRQDHDVDG
ncbi:DUF3772 domain-containing protein [Antarcticimicrobium sediminis]|uniref:Mechanosensitive ion channel family protein n=1 Tax=Antarcticimicrobium sediminis TaxID=2546227 RepID=A0A4R5EKC5_9RHOB|nr:DUF3772 domain-containing protein [Antarcticimicrobium sediminis]TDE35059.1 mechanosensitive ion channel family protein [Antarcticimicrobium sediminis]